MLVHLAPFLQGLAEHSLTSENNSKKLVTWCLISLVSLALCISFLGVKAAYSQQLASVCHSFKYQRAESPNGTMQGSGRGGGGGGG